MKRKGVAVKLALINCYSVVHFLASKLLNISSIIQGYLFVCF